MHNSAMELGKNQSIYLEPHCYHNFPHAANYGNSVFSDMNCHIYSETNFAVCTCQLGIPQHVETQPHLNDESKVFLFSCIKMRLCLHMLWYA